MAILIVEDNPLSAKLMDHSLKKFNYETVLANNGVEALDILKNNSSIKLVITDVMMPEMDGIELLKQIKNVPDYACTPVMVCTVLRDKDSITRATALGCKHYLLKPYRLDDLRAKVRECLRQDTDLMKTKAEIMVQYRLTEDNYGEVKIEFLKLLKESVAFWENEKQNNKDGSDSPYFENIHECAAIMGAERLRIMLENIDKDKNEGKLSSDDHRTLISEMKKLILHLSSY